MFTHAFIIIVNFFYLMSLAVSSLHLERAGGKGQVIDLSALAAEEVGVGLGAGIVTSEPLVNAQHPHGTLVGKQLQRVIDRSLGECRHRG